MRAIIYDISSLSYRVNANRTRISVLANGAVLGSSEINTAMSSREMVFLALDALLQAQRVDAGATLVYGLYNPYTMQVALNAVPKTEVYGDSEPLSIDSGGLTAELIDNTLWTSDRALMSLTPSSRAMLDALMMHSA